MRSRGQGGFTLIELMVAMFLTVIVSMMVYTLYDVATGAFAATEAELRYLQAFRSITDKMEVELNSICFKVGYTPGPGENVAGWTPPKFKAINEGMLQLRFENEYIGFYCSTDGRTIDRAEYYFNPPEPKILRDNGIDDDGDDPNVEADGYTPKRSELPCLLIDDTGSFMLRKTLDCDPVTWEYDETDDLGKYIYLTFEMYYEDLEPLDFEGGLVKDDGDILADGIEDVKFWYIWNRLNKKEFQMASRWPWDKDPLPSKDETGYTYGGKGLSYLSLPLGVQVDFTFETRGMERKLSKTVHLYSSLWNEFLSRAK